MSRYCSIVIVVVLQLVLAMPSYALFNRPGKGRIVDARTKKPVKGASVFIYSVEAVIPHTGNNHRVINTMHAYTDNKGSFTIPAKLIKRKSDNRFTVLIFLAYQPGYQLYTIEMDRNKRQDPDDLFDRMKKTIYLKRAPPNFNHQEHCRYILASLQEIDHTLGMIQRDQERPSTPATLQIEENARSDFARFCSRFMWEYNRSYFYRTRIINYPYEEFRGTDLNVSVTEPFDTIAGDTTSDESIPVLIELLDNKDPYIRCEAAFKLGTLKNERAADPLIAHLKDDDINMMIETVISLGKLNSKKAIDPLLGILSDGEKDWPYTIIRQEAIIALGYISAADIMEWEVGEDGKEVNKKRYGVIDTKTKKEILTVLLKNFNNEYLKPDIIGTLGQLEARDSFDLLLTSLEHPVEQIRVRAAKALSSFHDAQMNGLFIKLLKDPNTRIKKIAISTLHKTLDFDQLLDILDYKDSEVAETIIDIFREHKNEKMLKKLPHYFGTKNSTRELFFSIARKTCKERVWLFRNKGEICITQNNPDSDKPSAEKYGDNTKYYALLTHPAAVESLFAFMNCSDEPGRLETISLLGRFNDTRIEDELINLLDDPSPAIREEAVSALRKVGSKKALAKLNESIRDEDAEVRSAAFSVFWEITGDSEDSFHRILEQATYGDEIIRREAIYILGESNNNDAVSPLIHALKDPSPIIRRAAAFSLSNYHDQGVLRSLFEALNDENPTVRTTVLHTIKNFNEPEFLDVHLMMLRDADPEIRLSAVKYFEANPDAKAVEALMENVTSQPQRMKGKHNYSQSYLKRNSVQALVRINDPRAMPAMIGCLKDKNREVKRLSINFLKENADERAVPALIECLKDKDRTIACTAIDALAKIGDTRAVPALIERLEFKSTRKSSIKALGDLGDPRAVPALMNLFNSNDTYDKSYVLEAFAKLKNEQMIPVLRSQFIHDTTIKDITFVHFVEIGGTYALDVFEPLLQDPEYERSLAVLKSIGRVRDERALKILLDVLHSYPEENKVVAVVIDSLCKTNYQETEDILLECLHSESHDTRNKAFQCLYYDIKSKKAVAGIIEAAGVTIGPSHAGRALLSYKDPEIADMLIKKISISTDQNNKLALIYILGEFGDKKAIPVLERFVHDPSGEIKKRALQSIYTIIFGKIEPKLCYGTALELNPNHMARTIKGPSFSDSAIKKAYQTTQRGEETESSAPELASMIDDLKNEDPKIRRKAFDYLAINAYRDEVDRIVPLLTHEKSYVKHNALELLKKLISKDKLESYILNKLTSLSEDSMPEVQILVGDIYSESKYADIKNKKEARRWYMMAAEKGSAVAQYKLGKMYLSGDGTLNSRTKALIWFEKAAEQGNSDSQHMLGNMNSSDDPDLPISLSISEEGIHWHKKAAEQGNTSSQVDLGCLYKRKKDYAESIKWYKKAVESGNKDHIQTIGSLYEKLGNYDEALNWYSASARERGTGMLGMGNIYELKKNYTAAMDCYKECAANGITMANYYIATLYERGYGVQRDYKEAMKYYKISADIDAQSKRCIGRMFEQGKGVKKDITEAFKWYHLAAKGMDTEAQELILKDRGIIK